MGKLINIDNGGTLTDFCALDGDKIYHTKSLTTPFDLSKCFFDGLKKLARDIYGDENKVGELLQSTDYIRYSTTQGTNALVERKGPRLGLLVAKGADISTLKNTDAESCLLDDLIGDRIGEIDLSLTGAEAEMNIVKAVNEVASNGASRVVLSIDADSFKEVETQVSHVVGRKFPSHLLGVVPVLSASELSDNPDYARRSWAAIMNAFLHPAMERFLYSADHRLKEHKTKNPLLIFRNDGGAARVAKTMALKSYSSGPRGGMEGVKVLADHYDYKKLLSYDVGGTTTDIGVVEEGVLDADQNGLVEGVGVGFPMANVFSAGVGGSSVIKVVDGSITVGPESVGAAPGPACFGLGGKQATITDVFLLLGVLDPSTYFGGELNLDAERSKDVILNNVANPLGLELHAALEQMFSAWVQKIADALRDFTSIDDDTTLAGFGGAGALAATRIASASGAKRVIIPGLGAVFSAVGIGFSPLSQDYHISLDDQTDEGLSKILADSRVRAEKDMYAEGVDIKDCNIEVELLRTRDGEDEFFPVAVGGKLPCDLQQGDVAVVMYRVSKDIQRLQFKEVGNEVGHEARINCLRRIMTSENTHEDIPVIRLEEQDAGATINGPVIIEEAFFTGLVDSDWSLTVSGNRDLILEKI